jgi:D-apionolactonase
VLDQPVPSEAERGLALVGTDEPASKPRVLAAGQFSAEFIGGNLRNIRFAGREVIRAISYVVRDKDWGTYAPTLDNLAVDEDDAGFRVSYTASIGSNGERLTFRATIRAEGNALAFEADAVPEQDFLTSRCGFTILHPIVGLAGRPVEVEHVDGTVERSVLPDLVDPYQPFKDMRAITHDVMPGVTATCRMVGDSFEMEDQRNWTDASYKTYVRPLALPWPYVMPGGVLNRQAVHLTIQGALPSAAVTLFEATPEVRIEVGEAIGPMPKFGLVLTPGESDATLTQIARLKAIAPQLLLCHYDPTVGHGVCELAAYAQIARQHEADVVLECVVPCERQLLDEFAEIADQVSAAGLTLDAIAVSPSVDRRSTPPGSRWPECPPLEEVYAAARRTFPSLALGGGMFSYFTELNRKRPPADKLDFVTHCTCPIVHDADDRSVMQSLEALPFVLRSARAIIGHSTPYRIGPSTIGMRQNPYGSRTMPNPDNRRITMTECDPRQCGLFAAAWMIGYAARLPAAGIEAFTGAALTGRFGAVETDGTVRPVFHAARLLAELAGWKTLDCRSSAEDRMLALAACSPEGKRVLLLANLSDCTQKVILPWGEQAAVLDETTLAGARGGGFPAETPPGSGLALKSYAVAWITG